MKEDCISSSMTTGSIRGGATEATYLTPAVRAAPSSSVDECVLRVRLDEGATGFDVLAHQDGEHPVGLDRVLEIHSLQYAGLGVHRGLPELLRVHLAETLEPRDLDLLVAVLVLHLFQLLFVQDVGVLPVRLHPIQRRLRD